MMKLNSRMKGAVASAVLLAAQAWAGTPPAEGIVFPEVGSEWLTGGTFVNRDNLRQAVPGLSKDQLYDLLGRPHFKTGMFAVREWDYLFNMRSGKGGDLVSCQYKVVFDDEGLAKAMYWKSPACGELMTAQPRIVPQQSQ